MVHSEFTLCRVCSSQVHCCCVPPVKVPLCYSFSLFLLVIQSSTTVFPDYGTIRKVLSPLNQSTGSCLLEEIELFPPRKRQIIRSLLILHSRSELYVGVRDQVIKIPLKRCSYHKSREWVTSIWGSKYFKIRFFIQVIYYRGLCVGQGHMQWFITL